MAITRALAIDLGASGGKAFVGSFEEDRFTMQEIHRFAHGGVSFFTPDGSGTVAERTYWDDVAIYDNIVQALHIYRRDVADHLDAIAVDTWGADGQLLGPQGESLGKMYAYRDHRLDNMVEQVKRRIDARRMYELTGIHFQFFNVSGQLLWLVENRPHLLMDGARFLPAPSLFTWYLSGEEVVDSTWASVSQLMDAAEGTWSREILEALGIPPRLLPRIVPAGTRVGRLQPMLAEQVGLNTADVMAVGAHDTACAFAAAPIDDPVRSLIISSGTWSIVGKLVPRPITTTAALEANVSNEGGIGNTRLLKNVMGTWLAQELRRVWTLEDGTEPAWKDLDALTEAVPAFETWVDPDDAGFANPPNMRDAIDAFCARTGQSRPRNRGAYLRTVYESLALKYRMVNEQICAVSDSTTDVVNVVGGGCRNEMLNQFTANALGLRVVAGPEEATAVGNLMTQALACGLIADLPAAQPLIRSAFPIREFTPRETAAWDEAYHRFEAMVANAAG